MTSEPENTGRNQAGQFAPGVSGNPEGKPKGARHKSTLAIQRLLDGEAEAIARKAIELAIGGDLAAIRLVLERVIPARKDSPISVDLPSVETAQDAVKASAAILTAVCNGEITPAEASELAKVLSAYVETLKAHEFDQRIKALEGQNEGKRK